MALKDWKKIAENKYKLKNGKGEIQINQKSYYSINMDMSSGRRNEYYVEHSYIGDGGHPDIKTFGSKINAHTHLMKIIKK